MPDPLSQHDSITLGGGCFWCLEAVYRSVRGVSSVEVGYANGQTQHPRYEEVCSGLSGHVEVARLQYDPAQISLQQILEVFFTVHDPTTLNRQGNDVGTQYRSGIYTHTPEQLAQAQAFVEALNQSNRFGARVVTEVLACRHYWPAEPEHQNYFANYPNMGYCAFVVAPKVEKFRRTFVELQHKLQG
jgi:peptide-methionine (S)-S-oxide reductase